MATDGLFDSYVKIYYHSAFAPHSHTIPIRPIETTGLGDAGTLLNWSGDSIAADTMVKTMIDKMAEIIPSTTVYDKYTLYKWNPVTLVFNPVFEETYSVTGSAVGLTGQAKAVQNTLSIRTLGFGLLKIVFLDRPSNNTWGNDYDMTTFTEIIAEATSAENAWAGRDNTRPFNATNVSISLNKRLRRKYNMI
jgi:hypothetical protein